MSQNPPPKPGGILRCRIHQRQDIGGLQLTLPAEHLSIRLWLWIFLLLSCVLLFLPEGLAVFGVALLLLMPVGVVLERLLLWGVDACSRGVLLARCALIGAWIAWMGCPAVFPNSELAFVIWNGLVVFFLPVGLMMERTLTLRLNDHALILTRSSLLSVFSRRRGGATRWSGRCQKSVLAWEEIASVSSRPHHSLNPMSERIVLKLVNGEEVLLSSAASSERERTWLLTMLQERVASHRRQLDTNHDLTEAAPVPLALQTLRDRA